MKFTIRIPIRQRPAEVSRLMRATNIMKDWESNFKGFVPKSGAKRRVGSTATRIYTEPDGKETRMMEKVTTADKETFGYQLFHEHFTSEVECRFLDQGEGSTVLVESTKVRFRPALLNTVGWFLKGKMKKKRAEDLDKFKEIAENIKMV